MSKKITESEFIRRAVEKYGTKYNYDNLNYKSYSEEVSVLCPTHGYFRVKAREHLHTNTQCNWCVYGRASKKYTTEDFITEARQVHGDKYCYKEVDYKNCDHPVKILCEKHGYFMQSPYNHLRKAGCRDCWYEKASEINRHSLEDFERKGNAAHNNKYDYSLVEYVNNRTQVEIVCPLHGSFLQTPHDHLAGNGCVDCAYMDRGWGADGFYGTDEPSNLYLVTMSNREECFLKVGLAKDIKDRFQHFDRETNYQTLLKYRIENVPANVLFKLEQDIIHRRGFLRYRPKIDFRGKTECLDYSEINNILDELKKRSEEICMSD